MTKKRTRTRPTLPYGHFAKMGISSPMAPAASVYRAVARLNGDLWHDLDWKLAQTPSMLSPTKGRKAVPSPLAFAEPVRLGALSYPGVLWTLMALFCKSQRATSAPGQWATLGSERYRPRARVAPTEVLPPPYVHTAFLYLHLGRFPPAADALGIPDLLSDPGLRAIYQERYRKAIEANPIGRLLTQAIEIFVPPERWPDHLLETIIRHKVVTPYAPSPRRVADVLLMGTPFAPSPTPRTREGVPLTDVVEPQGYLLLNLLGVTCEQMAQVLPLTASRIAEIASQGLARILASSQIFWVWFSGVDTRALPCAGLIDENTHRALERDAYPAGWGKGVSHVLRYHIERGLQEGTAQPRPVPSEEDRVPAGHTWATLEEALDDPRTPFVPLYARYRYQKDPSRTCVSFKRFDADLKWKPEDPTRTYGRITYRHIAQHPLYALSRPESRRLLEKKADLLLTRKRTRR